MNRKSINTLLALVALSIGFLATSASFDAAMLLFAVGVIGAQITSMRTNYRHRNYAAMFFTNLRSLKNVMTDNEKSSVIFFLALAASPFISMLSLSYLY